MAQMRQPIGASGQSRSGHIARRFVLAFTQIDDMAEQTVRSPLDVADLDDHFGAHPMHATQHEPASRTGDREAVVPIAASIDRERLETPVWVPQSGHEVGLF